MTPQAPLRASLALGGMFILASSLLVSAPVASAEPSTEAVETINDRYTTFGGESSLLGAPLGEAVDVEIVDQIVEYPVPVEFGPQT